MLTGMEYYDPDEVILRNSPLLVPRKLTLDGPTPLEPWNFDPKINTHYEPWEPDNLLENEILSRLVGDSYV